MTIQEFIDKWKGKPVDTDGIYPNQCMDLMHQFLIDMYGLTDSRILAADSAYKVYTNFDTIFGHEKFDRIPNTPDGVPQAGDLVFFDQSIGQWGHVGIAIDGNTDSFRSFDANWPTGTLPHIQIHTYNGVLGWLRYKAATPIPDDCPAKLIQITAERDRLNGVITGKDDTINHLGQTIDQKNSELATLQATVSNLESQVTALKEQLAVLSEQANKVVGLAQEVQDLTDSRANYMKQLSACQTQVGKIRSSLIPKKYLSLKLYNLIMSLE